MIVHLTMYPLLLRTMLSKRSAQDWLFDCGQAFRALAGDGSFYIYLAGHRHELFSDDDSAPL